MFLPISVDEVKEYGWDEIDFILVSGDSYIDHPSFGVAIISRVLESEGFRVAILPQPRFGTDVDFLKLGQPKYGFLITAGNIDSMVNHYTVAKKKREKDYYTPNGEMGKRPNDATITYCMILKRLFPNTPLIIGGIEASLRRLTHYDYIKDKLRPSILVESKADLLLYGMSENSIVEMATQLREGKNIKDIRNVRGTVFQVLSKKEIPDENALYLPTHQDCIKNKTVYAQSFSLQYQNTDAINAKTIVEPYGNFYIVQNKPSLPLTRERFDYVYSLPYMRSYHSSYKNHIPAIEEVQNSIIINRGCFGSCSFCALSMHQGRIIQSRSKESILEEANKIIKGENFKGYINDIGGPTANFYKPSCSKQIEKGTCIDRQCLHPKPCPSLKVDHSEYLDILKAVRVLPSVKKVFIRSGIRYDYLMYDKNDDFFNDLVKFHISGQLKVAPEHISNRVLEYMQKPKHELFDKFVKKYEEKNNFFNKNQFLVPYLMSSHPGSTINDAIELAEYIHEKKLFVEQVQDFYPTPGTLATAMYYTGIDPRDLQPVFVEKNPHEKAKQRALIQYRNPNNYDLVYEALTKANRRDLIGYSPKSLIKPKKFIK